MPDQIVVTEVALDIVTVDADQVVVSTGGEATTAIFQGEGSSGLVPDPGSGDDSRVLRADGTWGAQSGGGGGGSSDHGGLTGLTDDDHTQYLLVDGTRQMTGDLDLGSNDIVDVGDVDGRDVSADGTKLDGIETGATADQTDSEIVTAYGNEVPQVSAGEKTAGTETAIRRFSPLDVADMAGTHGGGGSSDHGALTGLGDDDHTQYAEIANTESITGPWTFGNEAARFDNAAGNPTHAEGKLFYDSTEKALSYYNDEEDVTVNIAQENLIRVRNSSGSTISNGSAVYISGATGQTPNIDLAQADALETAECIGIATHDIGNNSNGYVTTLGNVNGLDTSAFSAGDELFLSAATAGALTNVAPTGDNYIVPLGYATTINPAIGQIKMYPHPIAQEADLTGAGDNETITGTWTFSTQPSGIDHGALDGLADDDHTQYLLADGTRAMSGDLDMGSNAIVTVGNVDGRDVSADGTKLDTIETNADVTDETNVTAAHPLSDATSLVKDPVDGTKTMRIDVGAVATSTTRVLTMPDDDVNLGTDFAAASHTHVLSDITDSGDLAALDTVGTTEIDNDAVTNAKLRNSSALSVIGRSANSTGDPADIAAGTDAHVLRRSGTALGFGQVVAGGIATNAVTSAKINASAVTTGKIADLNVTEGKLAAGAVATAKIADEAVTNAKLAHVATDTIKGRTTTGTGDVEDLSASQAKAVLDIQASDVTNDSTVSGATVDAALDNLASQVGGGGGSATVPTGDTKVEGDFTVSGTTTTEAHGISDFDYTEPILIYGTLIDPTDTFILALPAILPPNVFAAFFINATNLVFSSTLDLSGWTVRYTIIYTAT